MTNLKLKKWPGNKKRESGISRLPKQWEVDRLLFAARDTDGWRVRRLRKGV